MPAFALQVLCFVAERERMNEEDIVHSGSMLVQISNVALH